MPTRYLKPGIRDSDRIEALHDPDAEILFYRLLIVVDDFGRFDARPLMVKAACFPIRMRVNADNCMQWLKMLDNARLIGLYDVGGKPYLQIAKWDNKPRAIASKFPDPPADVYKRMQMLPVTVTVTVTGNRNREPETGNRKPRTGTKADAAASRLPADWLLPDAWEKWAIQKRGWSTEEIRNVSEGFRDYWIAKPGRDGRKLDWFATWRTWVRNQRGGNGVASVAAGNKAAVAEFLAKSVEKEIEGERIEADRLS